MKNQKILIFKEKEKHGSDNVRIIQWFGRKNPYVSRYTLRVMVTNLSNSIVTSALKDG